MNRLTHALWPFSKEYPPHKLKSYRLGDGRLWEVGRKADDNRVRRIAAVGTSAVTEFVGYNLEKVRPVRSFGSKIEKISEGIDAAIRTRMVHNLAVQVHESERQTHPLLIDGNGRRAPELKPTTDTEWQRRNGSSHVDLANTSLWGLPRDWLNENLAEASLVLDLLWACGPDALSRDGMYTNIGNVLYDQWQERNNHRLGGQRRAGSFAELTPKLQERDIEHFRLAASMFPDAGSPLYSVLRRDLERRPAQAEMLGLV